MIKVAPILALFIFACAELPRGEDDAADSASEGEGDSDETAVSEDMATCGPMPDDFVCVPHPMTGGSSLPALRVENDLIDIGSQHRVW